MAAAKQCRSLVLMYRHQMPVFHGLKAVVATADWFHGKYEVGPAQRVVRPMAAYASVEPISVCVRASTAICRSSF